MFVFEITILQRFRHFIFGKYVNVYTTTNMFAANDDCNFAILRQAEYLYT